MLKSLLAEDVYLRDWELAENGIENVINMYKHRLK